MRQSPETVGIVFHEDVMLERMRLAQDRQRGGLNDGVRSMDLGMTSTRVQADVCQFPLFPHCRGKHPSNAVVRSNFLERVWLDFGRVESVARYGECRVA